MNELKSYTEYAVSTPTADFVIGFDFNYGEDAVNVTVDDVPATKAGYTVVYLNETTIRLSPSVVSGVVRLQRETDIDQTDHAYRAGAKFIAQTMDENFEQLRHSQQEVRDGFVKLADDTYEIINTLNEVGQSAQAAADAAEVAAQLANNAAAQVNDKVSYEDFNNKPHNDMLGRDVASAHPTKSILDGSGETQQQINYSGGAKWYSRTDGYQLKERVVLTNGDIVKSTINGNMNNPNSDMTGWVKSDSAGQIFDESGLSQQDINDSNKRLSSNVLDFFTKSELTAWKNNPNTFDASDAIIRAQTLSPSAEITFPTGTFRITKKIPSTKSWRGVRGGYNGRGTQIVVDNTVAINGVIDCSEAHQAVELHDIQFEDKQRLLHTLLIEGVYQGFYSGIRVGRFKVGIQTSGTYIYFEKCYFVANGVGIRPTPTANTGNAQSTMFGCRECFFIYNDIGFDVSGVSAADDLINVPFISCGFELNRIGLSSPNRTWYLTLLNCWFEANSAYGLYAPTSHLLEINTRHNANSPLVIDPNNSTKIFGMTASFVDLEVKGAVTSNIKFPVEYSSTGATSKGKTISQTFTDDGGGVTAEIAFVREKGSGNYGGSGIEFSTAVSTTSPTMYARWGISRYGVLAPKTDNTYQLGSPNSRCSAIYTAKVMYTESVGDFYGNGSPEGVVTASVGSTYRRIDGVAGQPTFYTKATGLGNTGWKAVSVVA